MVKNHLTVNKLILIAIILALALVIWLAWLIYRPANLDHEFVNGNGRIEATEIDIATKTGGRVVKVYAKEGEFVKAGQVLAEMQTEVLNAQRDEAEAVHQHAIGDMATAIAHLAERESDLAAALAEVVQRESELDAAKRRYTRSLTLAKEGAVSLQVLDDDRAAVHGREANVNVAKAKVAAARSAILAMTAEVESSKTHIVATAATIKRINAEITDSVLKAPRDGRIQYQIAEPGEVIGSGGKVLSMVDLSDVYMTFFLPETVAGRVALGSEVRIILDALPDYVIPAKISFVASTAQFTPKTVETASERQKLMFRVKAHIDPELLRKYLRQVKTGVPGTAWVRLNPKAAWPKKLQLQVLR